MAEQRISAEQNRGFDGVWFAGEDRVVDFGGLDESRIGRRAERMFVEAEAQLLLFPSVAVRGR